MSAKRVLMENVAKTRVGATSVPADEGPAEGDLGGKCTQKWPESEIYKGTLFTTVFQKCASHRRRGANFTKKWQKFERKGVVKHERQKENSRSHTTFTKLQLLCRQSFLQTGLGGENSTGVEPQAVFEGDMERAHSEANEQQSDKSKQHLQKLIILKPFGGQKSEIFDRMYSKSFFRIVLPTEGGEHIFAKNWKNKWCNAKMHAKCVLQLTFSMQIRIKVCRW